MPLYLVRWPDLTAALVSAENEDALIDVLDEVANPEGCTWRVYRGPVFIEFAVNADVEVDAPERDRPIEPGEIRLGDVSRVAHRDVLSASVTKNSDTAYNMVDAVLRIAFPTLRAALDTDGETVPEATIRAALSEELNALVRTSWLTEQTKRRGDEASRLAATMGTSRKHAENVIRNVRQASKAKPERPKGKPPGKGPKRSPKK